MRSGRKCWWRCPLEPRRRSLTSNTASRGRGVIHLGQCQGRFGMVPLGCFCAGLGTLHMASLTSGPRRLCIGWQVVLGQ